MPSVVPLWKGADWMEREVYDMFGIVFDGHPDLRRILMPDEFTAFPLRKDYPLRGRGERHNFPGLTRAEAERSATWTDWPSMLASAFGMTMSIADAIAEPGREPTRTTCGRSTSARSTRPRTPRCGWSSSSTARRVVEAVPDIGYLHCGFEKLGEDLDYNQYVTIVDRMNYISPIANEVAWHGAVEKLLGIELTPRCKYLRTIVAELARISDHLLCIGAAGARPRGVHGLPLRVLSARE